MQLYCLKNQLMNTKINKSDVYILAIYFIFSFIIQFFDYYERGAHTREFIFDFPIELITTNAIILIYVFWLIPKFIITKQYASFTFLGILILVFFSTIDYTVGFWSGKNDWNDYPIGLDYLFKMIDIGTNNSAFPFALLLTKKFYEGQTQFLKMEKQQKENELKLLRSQLDPHFLFNNLNTLDSLIDSDSEKAKEYINRLSLIYRYLIKTKDSEVMELEDEIQLAENYIFLIQTRFGVDYHFQIEKQSTLTDKFIPTGAIQTLLENVVKHNKPDDKPIKTSIIIENNKLTVVNEKSSLKNNKESFGTGLENLKTRYQLLSDQEILVVNTDNKFEVTIPIINLIE